MQSFSEIDTTSKRASKAAGFAWGIAEEIGKNMRNLEMFGLPGIKNLNLYLQKIKKTSAVFTAEVYKIKFYLCFLVLNLPPLTSFSKKLPTCSPTSVNMTPVAPS